MTDNTTKTPEDTEQGGENTEAKDTIAAPESTAPAKQKEAPAEKKQSTPDSDTVAGESPEEPETEVADVESKKEASGEHDEGRRHDAPRARVSSTGIAYVKATFNNTMVSITDSSGGVVAWSSGGRAGFKGSRKSTSFAATIVGQEAARQALSKGVREVEVRIQGAGAGRESAVRALQSAGMNIAVMRDVTPIPHNGCRARKRRRV